MVHDKRSVLKHSFVEGWVRPTVACIEQRHKCLRWVSSEYGIRLESSVASSFGTLAVSCCRDWASTHSRHPYPVLCFSVVYVTLEGDEDFGRVHPRQRGQQDDGRESELM